MTPLDYAIAAVVLAIVVGGAYTYIKHRKDKKSSGGAGGSNGPKGPPTHQQ
jgi:hypothetical protein